MFASDDDREAAYAGADADYAVRCQTPGCDCPVSLPEIDTYCADCRREQCERAAKFQDRITVKARIEQSRGAA